MEFDDRTPTGHGRRLAAGLTNAYLFELPGLSHGQPSACGQAITVSFLENPTRRPDAPCLATMPALVFETKDLDPINLSLTIASDGNRPSPFAGRWAAFFPAGGRVVYRIDLRIVGQDVTDTVTAAQAQSFFDGQVRGETLTFNVRSPNGDRTVTFSGTLAGDEIEFTRSVEVRPGGALGGAALFGVNGAREFTAERVN